MSRIGKLSVNVPEGIDVVIDSTKITVSGTRGSLFKNFSDCEQSIKYDSDNKIITVNPLSDSLKAKAMWGTVRSIISNMVTGVYKGFTIDLEIVGSGYKASVDGDYLNLSLGKSHPVKIYIDQGINVQVLKNNLIKVSSVDKELLGQYVALIKKQRPVEPYKGKGIKIVGEYVIRKEGKKH